MSSMPKAPVLSQREEYSERQLKSVMGHSAGILDYLKNPQLTDLAINDDGAVWTYESGGRGWQCVDSISGVKTASILQAVADIREIPLNHANPILETTFPIGSGRIEGVLPPVVSQAALAIRTRSEKVYTMDDYEDAEILTSVEDPRNDKSRADAFSAALRPGLTHRQILRLAVQHRRNMIVVGATWSGKTTFLNALIHEISKVTPGDRLVMIEDTPELQCSVPNHLFLLATSKIPQSDCLAASLRLRPDRILVGEVRRKKPAKTLLESWNTGHSGGLATIHADDAIGGLYRLEEMLEKKSARARIARAVHLVVFLDAEPSLSAGRKVRQLLVVRGLKPNGDYDCHHV